MDSDVILNAFKCSWSFHRRLSSQQSNFKAQRESKKSNVTVTMTYLGQGHRGSGLRPPQDELKVLQQVNGGENICVFNGGVTPGGRSFSPECAISIAIRLSLCLHVFVSGIIFKDPL